MKSKEDIKKIALRNAIRVWGIKTSDQLDPAINLLIEVFCALSFDTENSIEDIKERLLDQIANVLTPDNLIAVKPSHSVLKMIPIEPELFINQNNVFYTDYLTPLAKEFDLKTIKFSPVINNIKLVKGEIKYLLCERDLYKIENDGYKEIVTRANSFYQDLNRCVWVGMSLDNKIASLKNIHFYFDFINTPNRFDLYELLLHTTWSIGDKILNIGSGLAGDIIPKKRSGGIFSLYNTLNLNDEEVMDFYRKQFMHIKDHILTSETEKIPFPVELAPFFPSRVNELEPLIWIKIQFPSYFKKDDLKDISVHLNSFPISNKNIRRQTLFRNKNITGVLPLPVNPGEFFMAIEDVEDNYGYHYNFLPYSDSQSPLGGTYTIKRGGMERYSTRDLKNTVEWLIDLMRTESVVFNALKLDNVSNSISDIDMMINTIREKINKNNSIIKDVTTYLLIDAEAERKNNDIDATYWTTNCDISNGIPYGIYFEPLKMIDVEKDSCLLLKTTSGGKPIPKNDEMLSAYKYVLTTRDYLFSSRDIENYCYMKFSDKVQLVKVKPGIAVSNKPKEGLIRTVDVCITPSPDYSNYFDSTMQGELKLEIEKRSPDNYRYRIIIN